MVLYLVGVHSFCVGLGMIAAPEALFVFFGFGATEELFFRVQAGVFHMVMVYIYCYGAWRRDVVAIGLSIAAKFTAMLFLLLYYFAYDAIITVLVSGILDGAMGLLILLLYIQTRLNRDDSANSSNQEANATQPIAPFTSGKADNSH